MKGDVCLGTSKAACFGVALRSNAGFDRPLLAAKEISVVQTSQRRNAGRKTAGNLLVWTAPDGIKRARMRSLQISDKADRPWNGLAELGWIRRNIFSSFME
jgi:hypothetical protein